MYIHSYLRPARLRCKYSVCHNFKPAILKIIVVHYSSYTSVIKETTKYQEAELRILVLFANRYAISYYTSQTQLVCEDVGRSNSNIYRPQRSSRFQPKQLGTLHIICSVQIAVAAFVKMRNLAVNCSTQSWVFTSVGCQAVPVFPYRNQSLLSAALGHWLLLVSALKSACACTTRHCSAWACWTVSVFHRCAILLYVTSRSIGLT